MMARFQSSPGHCRYLVSFLLVWHGSAMEREREIYIYISFDHIPIPVLGFAGCIGYLW